MQAQIIDASRDHFAKRHMRHLTFASFQRPHCHLVRTIRDSFNLDLSNGALGLTLTLILLLFVGCADRWEGFVYPDKSDLTRHRNLGEFSSLDECRAAARRVLSALNALQRGDYECGKNCDDGAKFGGVKVCKETLR